MCRAFPLPFSAMPRYQGRRPEQLRPVRLQRGFIPHAEAAVLDLAQTGIIALLEKQQQALALSLQP